MLEYDFLMHLKLSVDMSTLHWTYQIYIKG